MSTFTPKKASADIGVYGLGVMGANLARNLARNGYATAVFNRTPARTDKLIAEHGDEATFVPASTLPDFVASLRTPRVAIMMVQAGPSTDAVMGQLADLMDEGDIIVDCGNSLFTDTIRREKWAAERGLHFVGAGVSGGEEGALWGPSIMPGGTPASYDRLGPMFEAIALDRLFGQHMPWISSTKGMTGHECWMAGASEVVYSILMMQGGFVAPNINFENPDEYSEKLRLATHRIDTQVNTVLSNSFGFGGNDTSLVFSALSASSKPWSQQPLRPVYVKTMVTFGDIPETELPRIPPLVARRLSGVLKRALLTSLVALQRSGIQQPQAIITGTAMGCVVETEKFLTELATDGEGSLKPTNFIHSTHNTISSLIAIHTHCHSYNSTYTTNAL